ncbi:hypothetical protein NKDENANG_04007 [Candidatus Entotheonellaceae bacterium PAL068K]
MTRVTARVVPPQAIAETQTVEDGIDLLKIVRHFNFQGSNSVMRAFQITYGQGLHWQRF